ncbi:MAG: EAL domain-containing protein [Gammaproteobacteria bacterium]|nr:EAL domain-containing protein [Gammaproteobacteria bacterium]
MSTVRPLKLPSVASDAESAPREGGNILKTLLANVDGMVYRRSVEAAGTLAFLSEGCVKVTGRQPPELLATAPSYEDIIYPDDRMWVAEAIRCAVAESRSFDFEYRIIHADGVIRWVWERGTGVYSPDGRPVAIEGFIQDITKRKNAETALREAERRYYGLFHNAVEGIFRTTVEGNYLDANPALALIYGYDSPEELIASLRDIEHQLYVDGRRRDEFISIMHARGCVTGFESQVYRKNGDVIWISESARAVFGEDGRPIGFEGTVEDITERRLFQARIEHQANYDTLTGLANRSLLQDRLQQALLASRSRGTRLAVAFVDLDRFKFINDSLGHQAGDELLKTTAARIQSCVRNCDTVARHGGDEFVLLINGHEGPSSIRRTMERVLAAVGEPWIVEQDVYDVTCSIGVALHPEDGDDARTLLKHADSAMYRAKDSGRNNFQFFTRELNTLMTERLEMESQLRRALERNQFVLHYQPRIALDSGRLIGVEALLRWRLPHRGTVSPGRFIALAEETGLIVPIGKWVLRTACTQNKAWQDAGYDPMVVSVNVSARQFRQEDLVLTVTEALQETGLAARYLELELTESMMMHDVPQLVLMLDELKRIGVQIAVDDFGTGYSSLSYLKRFPVDRLKVDKSFVEDIASDTDDAKIVRAIIALGHNLGLKVVAEGVESPEQLCFLRANHCDEVQGFLMGRPVSARAVTRTLRARGRQSRSREAQSLLRPRRDKDGEANAAG